MWREASSFEAREARNATWRVAASGGKRQQGDDDGDGCRLVWYSYLFGMIDCEGGGEHQAYRMDGEYRLMKQ